MDRDDLMTWKGRIDEWRATTDVALLQTRKEVTTLEDRLKAYDLWHAKAGAVPVAVSIVLAVVSILANVDTHSQKEEIRKVVNRIAELQNK